MESLTAAGKKEKDTHAARTRTPNRRNRSRIALSLLRLAYGLRLLAYWL